MMVLKRETTNDKRSDLTKKQKNKTNDTFL